MSHHEGSDAAVRGSERPGAARTCTGAAHRAQTAAVRRGTWIWGAVFCALWTPWLLVGYPQLDGRVVHSQLIPWNLDRDMVHLLNRGSELALFLAYSTLLPPFHRRPDPASAATPVTAA